MAIKKQQSGFKEEKLDSLIRTLDEIKQNPVLNGDFAVLCNDVNQVKEKIDQVHHAIYDPAEGIINKLYETQANINDNKNELKVQISDLENKQSNAENLLDITTKKIEKLDDDSKKIDEIVSWKTRVSSIVKWFGVTLIGSAIALAFKLLYDIITNHITFH